MAPRLWALRSPRGALAAGEAGIDALIARKREEVAAAIEGDDSTLADYLRRNDPNGWLEW